MSLQLEGIEAVLFDLDGTLLDSAPDLAFAANQLRVARGYEPLPLAHYRPFVGTGARGMLRIALGVSPEDAEFETLKEEFFAAYEQCMGRNSQLFDGVPELLEALQARRIAWGIVTNKSQRFALPIVNKTAAFSTAGSVVCGDTTPYSKPHPAPLWEAAKRMAVSPECCIYVGDDERDIQAAHAAGMQSIAAAYGYLGGAVSVESWQPSAVIELPVELVSLLGLN